MRKETSLLFRRSLCSKNNSRPQILFTRKICSNIRKKIKIPTFDLTFFDFEFQPAPYNVVTQCDLKQTKKHINHK